MENKWQKPEMEIIRFEEADIIAASGGLNEEDYVDP